MTRWTGFGQDRLYVRSEADEAVGWWDLQTDEGHPETAEKTDWLAEAVAEWRIIERASSEAAAEPEPAPEPEADEPVEDVDLDLESAECVGSLLPRYSIS